MADDVVTVRMKELPSETGPGRGFGYGLREKLAPVGRPVQVIKTLVILPTNPIPPNVRELCPEAPATTSMGPEAVSVGVMLSAATTCPNTARLPKSRIKLRSRNFVLAKPVTQFRERSPHLICVYGA